MYSPAFDYYRAGSVAEAQQLLQRHPGAKVLAGGHSLIPLLKMRLTAPSALVDIGRIGSLKGITTSGDTLRIGALTTHAELAASPAVDQNQAMDPMPSGEWRWTVRLTRCHGGSLACSARGSIDSRCPTANLPRGERRQFLEEYTIDS